MKKIFTLFILLAIGITSYGQQLDEEVTLKEVRPATRNQVLKFAAKEQRRGNLQGALGQYEELINRDSTDSEVAFIAAELSDRLQAIFQANRYYRLVELSGDRKQFPLLDFYYANNLKIMGDYDGAIERYQRFRSEASDAKGVTQEKITLSKQYEQACADAKALKAAYESDFKNVRRLDDPVNDNLSSSEFAPYKVDDKLYFTRYYYGSYSDTVSMDKAKFNVFYHEANKEGLQVAVRSGSQNAHTAFTNSGNIMFETDRDNEKRGIIYFRRLGSDGFWSDRIKLPEPINIAGYSSSQPAVAMNMAGEQVLYFSSNRPGGKGGMDLWQSVLKEDNGMLTFAQPTNLTAINTTLDDITPFYDQRCDILYFSTNGRPSLGGYDIYQAKANLYGWEDIKPLGDPVNSSFDDAYFFKDLSGELVYFASRRVDVEYAQQNEEYKGCCYDIYEAKQDIDIELSVAVYCGDQLLPEATYAEAVLGTRLMEGAIPLDINQTYAFDISKSGYTSGAFEVNTMDVCAPTIFREQVRLQKKNNFKVNVRGQYIDEEEIEFDKVTIELKSLTTGRKEIRENISGVDVLFDLAPDEEVVITASSQDYLTETDTIKAGNIENFCEKEHKMLLVPDLPNLPLPAVLYFENAIPRPIHRDSTYEWCYESYIDSIPGYKRQLTKYYLEVEQDTFQANLVETRVDSFFTDHVRLGYNKLLLYADALTKYMKFERPVNVIVKGYASPRASAAFNRALSERRVESVRKFLQEYKGGALAPYIGKTLKIKPQPLGQSSVDDDIQKKMDYGFGVFDPISAGLRKVVIERIEEND